MISAPDRQRAVELIEEAVEAGASAKQACEQLQISLRTYQRWSSPEGEVKADARAHAERSEPANKLSAQEKQQILEICNQPQYSSLAPSQIVPALADQGLYLASEASFYRVLREADQLHRRGKEQAPRSVSKPRSYKASAPNHIWFAPRCKEKARSWQKEYCVHISGLWMRHRVASGPDGIRASPPHQVFGLAMGPRSEQVLRDAGATFYAIT